VTTTPSQPSLPPEVLAMMNELVDAHEPAALGWWPPAIGWWLVTIVAAIMVFVTVKSLLKYVKSYRWKKFLTIELQRIQESTDTAESLCQQINQLLKRIAKVQFTNDAAAELSGEAWVDYLQKKLKPHQQPLKLSPLGSQAYQPNPQVNKEELIADVRAWIKQCC
jgi:hypothetical protein